jgi:hypothetical protein
MAPKLRSGLRSRSGTGRRSAQYPGEEVAAVSFADDNNNLRDDSRVASALLAVGNIGGEETEFQNLAGVDDDSPHAAAASERYEKRQLMMNILLSQHGELLNFVEAPRRPRMPTTAELISLPKRQWEARLRAWKATLRELARESGFLNLVQPVDYLTVELQRTLRREASRQS